MKYLTETLKTYGKGYSTSFWDVVFRGLLFPIFDDLKHSESRGQQVDNRVDPTEWLSTTCVFALRNVMDLYNFYFDKLAFLLDSMLELFGTFIKQGTTSGVASLLFHHFFFLTFLMLRSLQRTTHSPESAARV